MRKTLIGAPGPIRLGTAAGAMSSALWTALGQRFEDLERFEQAERAFTHLVEISAQESEGHQALARLRESQNRWEEAVQSWRHVVRIRSRDPAGWIELTEGSDRRWPTRGGPRGGGPPEALFRGRVASVTRAPERTLCSAASTRAAEPSQPDPVLPIRNPGTPQWPTSANSEACEATWP